ncbi:ATP-dependent helicase [Aeromicrobium terrae]|uniref:DNA 3'-5' helicase n=1 Tax=Aeromicrobium terrae TaxID=2498846 RepID=A0A5C8NLN6_9ACTN|nr:ATP-dependent DNA helicase [Aeromicrobium terrae]TXL61977.1 ATP-dependent helicase [Aeromicrobium terrae]
MSRFVRDEDHLRQLLGIPFSAEQMAAITAPLTAPGVIVAGAGSGKTTVMAARVVWLVGHDEVPPGQVLGLTFTKKAAAELGHRVRTSLLAAGDPERMRTLFDEHGEPVVSTYHAFAGSLITEHGLRLGLETDLLVTSDATRFQRAARVVRRYREPLPNLTILLAATVDRVLALDGALSEHLVTPEKLREHDQQVVAVIDALPKLTNDLTKARAAALERIDLTRLVEAYRADKLMAGVMDFSDQMAGGARLGIECPEVGEILRERFGVVLLDEYQDTSVAQRLMLQGLFGDGHPITAVGDPTQGIYGWRGASSDNIARFRQHFPAADGSEGPLYGLRVSRRCHPDILAVANRVAEPYFERHDELEPLLPDENTTFGRADVTVELHPTITEELDALVKRVAAARAADPAESVAILLRTREEMPVITAGLRRAGVDAEVVGLAGLLTLPHVGDVVSLLEVVADATANPAMLRLLTGDRWRIGARDLAMLGHRASTLARELEPEPDESLSGKLSAAVAGSDPTEIVSLADAVDDPGDLAYSAEALRRFAEVSAVIRTVRRSLGGSIADIVQAAIRRLDLDIETALLDTGASDDLARLVDVAADVGGRSDIDSLAGFIAYLRAEQELGQGLEVPDRARPGAVQVLTIHTAKGLEWDRVFVPLVVKGTFPSTRGRDRWTSTSKGFPYPLRGDADVLPSLPEWSNKGLSQLIEQFRDDDLSEEIRLAYVAFTRARTALHVSGHRWGRRAKNPYEVSPFLLEVADVCRGQGRTVDVWDDGPLGGKNPELDVEPVAWPRQPAEMAARRAAVDHPPADPTGDEDEAAELATLEKLDAEVTAWRAEEELAAGPVVVPLPSALSATQVLALADDEQAFARSLARPVPRAPSEAARFGSRFHAWVEAHYGIQPLLDPTELPGRGDADVDTDAELDRIKELFLAGPYADLTPVGVEVPFAFDVGGEQVIGRIDAVFATDAGFEVVDWKTNATASADPLQLAVYRLAWSELAGVDPSGVSAAFYYVRLDEVQRFTPDQLPGRDELVRLLRLG